MQSNTGHMANQSEAKKMAEKGVEVAVYDTYEQAAEAVRELTSSGIDMKKLSIISKDSRKANEVSGDYETQIRAGKVVVIFDGSPAEVQKMKDALAMGKQPGMKKHGCCA